MKIVYKTYLMHINQEGWKIYLVRSDCDISNYYTSKYDELRNTRDDTVIIFPSRVEPPKLIEWEYEEDSSCY